VHWPSFGFSGEQKSQRCFCLAELLAKKRRRDEQWAAEKATAAVEAKKKARTTRSAIFKKAESYVKEYRSQVLILVL